MKRWHLFYIDGKFCVVDRYIWFLAETIYCNYQEEEKVTEEWLRKLAIVLLTSGNKRFLVALSNCMADGIPGLARSCLVTVAWMSSSLVSWHNVNHLQSLVCTTLAPRLFESLSYHRAQEERVLASLSLFNFVRYPGNVTASFSPCNFFFVIFLAC